MHQKNKKIDEFHQFNEYLTLSIHYSFLTILFFQSRFYSKH